MMKKLFAVLFLSMFAVSCQSSDYWKNRQYDAQDIFDLTVGKGGGFKVQVGPVTLGVLYNEDKAGLRGGQCFWGTEGFFMVPFDMATPVPNFYQYPLLFSNDEFLGTFLQDERKKSYRRISEFPYPFVTKNVEHESGYMSLFQIDTVAAVGGSVRLGVNPAELVDFLLGWTTLDIGDDDVGAGDE